MMDGSASFSQTSESEKLRGMAYQYRLKHECEIQEIKKLPLLLRLLCIRLLLSGHKKQALVWLCKKGDAISYDYILVDPNGNLPETALWNSKANEGK